MVATQGPAILAHSANAQLSGLLGGKLAHSNARFSMDGLTILLATVALQRNPEEELIRKALDAWSRGELLVVSVDGATPPLGLRDVEQVAWTPGRDDAAQLAEIESRLATLAANRSDAKSGDRGLAPPLAQAAPSPTTPSSTMPSSTTPSSTMPSRTPERAELDSASSAARSAPPGAFAPSGRGKRLIAIAAALVVGVGLVSIVMTGQLTRNSALAPDNSPRTAASPAPAASPPPPAPVATPILTPAQPRGGGGAPSPSIQPARPSAAPDLSRPSGGGAGGSAPPPPSPSEPEPPAGLPEWAVLALWLVPAFLILAFIHYVVMRRRRLPAKEPVASTLEPSGVEISTKPSPAAPAPSGSTAGKSIFVSYSHQDIERVDPLIIEIERLGHPVWIDRRELSGGPGWAGQIVRALRAARSVVLMASRHAYASDQVVREMYLAMSEKKPIIPLELEAAEMPDELQYILAPFQRHRLEGGDRAKIIHNALATL